MEASTGKFTAIKKDGSDVEMEGIVFNKSNNLIYIATQNGLLKYDVASKQFQPTALTKKMPGKVENIYIDKGENIWLLITINGN